MDRTTTTITTGAERREAPPRRRGGRPTREAAARLQEKILETATGLFLKHGFGATSIEAVAAGAGISKRTFYHRFTDKAALFEAVVHRLIGQWLPVVEEEIAAGGSPVAVLERAARQTLAIALSPEALALHRLLVAEAQRFPKLAAIVAEEGSARGIARLADLLEKAAPGAGAAERRRAAEQFLALVLSLPQRRALGFGRAMSAAELDRWASDAVAIFLDGWRARR